MYLLDTNVVLELRKAKTGRADKNVMSWAQGVRPFELFLSVLSVLELEQGLLLIGRRDRAQAAMLRDWLENQVMPAFAGRVLPIDIPVALRCAKLHVPDPGGERDSLIAATALVHGMTIVTRNVADFAKSGVPIINPWKA